MKKLEINRLCDFIWMLGIALALSLSACNSQPSATTNPPESTPIPASATPVPHTPTPLLPTLTPTALPVPGPAGYLPALADLPAGFEWTNSAENQSYLADSETKAFYGIRYHSEAGWLFVQLTIATKPYEKLPDESQSGGGGTPVESAQVGQSSRLYVTGENPTRVIFSFIKGNVSVNIAGPISVETALNLAQIMEKRIPELVSDLTPITFPETLDAATFAKHITSIGIGTCDSNYQNFTPTAIFAAQDLNSFCFDLQLPTEELDQSRNISYALYDLQEQKFLFKYSSAHGFAGYIWVSSKPGQYEMRVAWDDVLVVILPFEVQP